MYKIAAIGDRDSVQGFASIGLEVYFADEKQEAEKLLKRIANDNYAVIYITEKLASMIPQEIEKYTEAVTPAIIPIPGVSGNTGEGMNNVSRFVEKAVGSDIIN
ncbi:MAG: V-type ATP synthase subunit F [Oscillospiraceae bacterium]|nr:V-type ATP synthase subunit F [Oscillospiraceae bacterium]